MLIDADELAEALLILALQRREIVADEPAQPLRVVADDPFAFERPQALLARLQIVGQARREYLHWISGSDAYPSGCDHCRMLATAARDRNAGVAVEHNAAVAQAR